MAASLPNYYLATAHDWQPQRPEPFETRPDIAIIGGGFTGISAALACVKRGYRVAVYEAQHIGYGASGRNGGQLIPGLRWSASKIWEKLGPDVAQQLFQLCWRRNPVRENIAAHQINCDLKSGFLEAAWKPAHFETMEREAEFLWQKFSYRTKMLPKNQLSSHIASSCYAGAAFDDGGGHFHPLNYLIGLAQAAEELGVRIFEHCHIMPEQVEAEFIIVAADSWIGDAMPKLRSYSVPIMNYNIATVPLRDPSAILPSDAAVADSRAVLNYFRLSADGRLIFGGGERYRRSPPEDIAAFVRPFMRNIFPELADIPIEYAWGGAVDVSFNRLPHIGRQGNIFYAHGFSGHGAMTTSLAGEIIAEAVSGTAEKFDLFANLPMPPFPGGPLLSQPLAMLGLFYYALKDRFG